MALFLGFLVLTIIIVPMLTLSQLARSALSLSFALTLIFGAFVTIRHRVLIYFVVALTISTVAVGLFSEFIQSRGPSSLEIALKLTCLSILVVVTLKQTLRPGSVTIYRVMGGIAGYLLIGITWSFAYQLVVHQIPDAIHFQPILPQIPARQLTDLIYFSFVTLTTVGYGDAYPVHPVARSLVTAEALVGQLYIATLIASLVGMALQTRASVDAQTQPMQSNEPSTIPQTWYRPRG